MKRKIIWKLLSRWAKEHSQSDVKKIYKIVSLCHCNTYICNAKLITR